MGGIDTCGGGRHLNFEAGGQEHTQWIARLLALPVLTLRCNRAKSCPYCDGVRLKKPAKRFLLSNWK